jgi:hypothetical protein
MMRRDGVVGGALVRADVQLDCLSNLFCATERLGESQKRPGARTSKSLDNAGNGAVYGVWGRGGSEMV